MLASKERREPDVSHWAEEKVDSANQIASDVEDDTASDVETSRPSRWVEILEWFDEKVYILVGITFLLAALLSLLYGLLSLGDAILAPMFMPAGFSLQALLKNEAGAQDIIALVSDLLLTLIIMEVLGTVVHHLQDGETTLRPFLFIGIISATRGILAVGARLSVSTNGTLSREEFIRDMVELGVNAIVIIALGVTMNLIGKYLEVGAVPRHGQRQVGDRRPKSGRISPSTSSGSGVSSQDLGLGIRTLFVLMILIILVALTLIGILVSMGHL